MNLSFPRWSRSLAAWLAACGALVGQEPAEDAARRARAIEENNRAVEALEAGRLDDALAAFERAHADAPSEAGIAANYAEALRRRGDQALEGRKWDAARADYTRAAELAPERSSFALLAALVPYRRGRWKEAEQALAAVIEKHPAEAEAYLARGSCQVRLLDVRGAVETWKRGLERASDHAGLKAALERYGPEAELEAELYTELTQNFAYHFHLGQSEVAREAPSLGRDLENAFLACQRYFLDHLPRERIHVLVYARGDFRRVTRVEGWVGGLFDGRIRVPLDRYQAEREQLVPVLRHELAHAFAHDLAGGPPPTWLDEGLAQILEGRDAAAARARLAAGGFPALADLRGPFLGLGEVGRVRAAYDAGLALTAELERRFGRLALRDYLEKIARARAAEEGAEVDPEVLFTEVFGLEFEPFVRQLAAQVKLEAERR
jgi:tetratricopeptide (TPR) repeat protein